MEYESKDCDEQKPGAGRAGNTSHDGQDYMLGMLCLVFAGGDDKSLSQQISKTALKSDDAPHIFSCWLVSGWHRVWSNGTCRAKLVIVMYVRRTVSKCPGQR